MVHRAHSPLAYDYHSHKPLATAFWWLDRPWWYYALTFLTLWIKYAPVMVIPMLTAYAIDGLAGDLSGQSELVFFSRWWFIPVLVFTLVQNIPSNLAFAELQSMASRRLEQNLRAGLSRRLQQLSIGFHDQSQSGKLQSKMIRDVENIVGLAYFVMTSVPQIAISLVWATAVTAIKAPELLPFFTGLVPLALIIQRAFRGPMKRSNKAYRGKFEAMSAKVSEMVEMVPVTRAHGVETREVDHVDSHLEDVRHRGRTLDKIHAIFGSMQWASTMLIQLLCLATTTYMASQGKIGLGGVLLYQTYFNMIVGAVNGILGMLPYLATCFESIHSLGEVLECPDIEENEGKAPVDRVNGRITFENVTFAYPNSDEPAIRNFSVDIAPGECVAFVGESGGGKSTLMNLAIGFHRAGTGRILLDGQDMNEIDMREYRNHVAVVPQRTILFAGTIRQNILYGLERNISEAQLREVLEAANVAEFIDKLPDGLNSVIGERGAKISGGQQQRISIARALIRDPKVIVLDEATSALDVISEALVQEAITRLIANRTTLIVAHRLSTVRNADRVVVMKGGECIELDSPANLLEAGGEFARLHNLQQMLL
jgi:ATP-binding cassette subfamily B protein